jgi:hypothetical protein
MVRVKFIYKDRYSHGKWNQQEGIFRTVKECIEWYGLGKDCEYRILEVEELGDSPADRS